MIFRTPLILGTVGLLAMTACTDTTGGAGYGAPVTDNSRTQTGAIIGGVLGAVVGAKSKGDSRLANAALGAAIGAGAGALIGNQLDKQAAELRGQVGNNIQVVNEGNQLRVVLPQDILFATDSTALQPTLIQDLRAVSRSLLNYPSSTVQVIGHTDNVGAAAYNQDLSQRRAGAVAAVLRDYGVPSGRLVAFGRGEEQPVASNLTPEGRAQNRRVEIIIRPNS